MAIYHLSVKAISRSAGRSATAAAAYRAGVQITDQRTGDIHDYTRKRGIESAHIVLPPNAPAWASDRAQLWNAAELAEKRKDAQVAREFEVALPAELTPKQRQQLALAFAKDMADKEGCAVDVAIHAPGRGGDNRNHHAHILRTTRKVEVDGLGAKLDTEKAGRSRADDLNAMRERWAELTNDALERAGHSARVDHRSLEAQGITDREPTKHLGPSATQYERRTKQPSRIRREQVDRNPAAALSATVDEITAQLSIARTEKIEAWEKRAQEQLQEVLKRIKDLAPAREAAEKAIQAATKEYNKASTALHDHGPPPTGFIARMSGAIEKHQEQRYRLEIEKERQRKKLIDVERQHEPTIKAHKEAVARAEKLPKENARQRKSMEHDKSMQEHDEARYIRKLEKREQEAAQAQAPRKKRPDLER